MGAVKISFQDLVAHPMNNMSTRFLVKGVVKGSGLKPRNVSSRWFGSETPARSNEIPHDSIWIDPPSNFVDVSDLAHRMRSEVREYTSRQKDICLFGVLATNQLGEVRPDAEAYSAHIAETTMEDGINYGLCRCSADDPSNVQAAIERLNRRPDVHGILVFYPIFKAPLTSLKQNTRGPYLNESTGVHYKTQDDYFRDVVSPLKDVEGLGHNFSVRRLFRSRAKNRSHQEAYIPCTAQAVLRVLDEYHDDTGLSCTGTAPESRWSGCTVTVVNRSEIFGRPLAAMLALSGATVYSVDESSILQFRPGGKLRRCNLSVRLEDCMKQSSIIVSGVPSPHFELPDKPIQAGTTVVNVSEFSAMFENSQLCERNDIRIIPQIGKVTVAALEQNLLRLHQQAVSERDS